MPSILDFFKPVRKDKRQRGGDAVKSTEEELSVAVPMPRLSTSDDNHKPRNNSDNKAALASKMLGGGEPPSKRQAMISNVEPAAAPVQTPIQDGLSEYEQKRQAKMASNAKFLEKLGMISAQLEMTSQLQQGQKQNARQASKRSKIKRRPEEEQPVRRSSRLRGEAAPALTRAVIQDGSDESDGLSETVVESSFTESSVLRYSVDGDIGTRKAPPSSSLDGPNRDLVGFQVDPKSYLSDHELKKAYCISFSSFKEHGLIAAAGSNGRVSLFPFSSSYHQPEIGDGFADDPAAHIPLMSFKAHSGWISAVSLARSIRGRENLLLTASNDCSVKLWDLNHCSAKLSMPKEILSSTCLHHKGIFGMDVCGDSVLTCSKDATVVLSQFCPDTGTLLVDQRFEDHGGVVKCVRFAQGSTTLFASGGNDREVRVYDTRAATNPLVTRIGGVHHRAINSVQFHPTDDNLLLSAGFDPNFYLFDLRRAALPVSTFLKPPQSADNGKAIFHPIFVRNGQGVVAARGHDLSLYKTSDGAAVSRGYIDDAATCIAADPFHDRIAMAQGGKLQFADARWEYKTM